MNGNQLFAQSTLPLTGLGFPPQFAPPQGPYVQQAQLAPQGFFGNLLGQLGQPVGSAVGSLFGQPNLGGQIGGIAGQLGGRFLPFAIDPVTAAYAQQAQQAQQAQLAPQGFFGNLLGQVGQPLGSAIGSVFGQPHLGGQIGGIAGQLGGRFLPFSIDPIAAAYAQQAQLGQQGIYGGPFGLLGQQLLGGVPSVLH